MKKIKLFTLLGLGSFSLLPLAAIACGRNEKQVQGTDKKETPAPIPTPVIPGKGDEPGKGGQVDPGKNTQPGQEPNPAKEEEKPTPGVKEPDTGNENSNPSQGDKTVDENAQGGVYNGLAINEYKGLIGLYNLNRDMTASKAYSILSDTVLSNDDYKLTEVKVTDFNDLTGTLSFTVKGTYKGVSLDNKVFNISNFFIVKSTMVLNVDWNTTKIMEEQKTSKDFIGKSYSELKPYLSSIVLSIDGNSINILNDDRFSVNSFSLSEERNHLSAFISISYHPEMLNQDGVVVVQKPITVYHRAFDYLSGLNYSIEQYLQYILNNQLSAKENIDYNYYPSFFAGKKAITLDFWNHFFDLNEKYERLNNEPIIVTCSYYPNDLTGELYVTVSLEYNPENGLGNVQVGYKSFKFSGFKKLTKEELAKDFMVIPDSFGFMERDQYRELVKTFMALSPEEQKTFEITNSNQLLRIMGQLGGSNAILTRLVWNNNGGEKLEYLLKSFDKYIKLYYKNKSLTELSTSLESRILGGKYFQIGRIAIDTKSLSDFTLQKRNDGNNRIDFKWNFTLEIEIQDATGESNSSTTIQIPQSMSIFALENKLA
ncbi:lipoprotein 17-related variable surface protein [Mycoplasma sp. Sp48II]|uniref:lipoprotein 17-related variable surface protein n=1 Tax=Mycoplasma sp. Sp48II TaxID=3401682 RepID=UPI003AAF4726